jgi:DNA segregation ATPase FtsK/SpoIIIE-like protein
MFFKRKRHPLEELASLQANIIRHQLTRLNLAYRSKTKGREEIQRVEFVEPLIATPAEIRIEVDVNRLPRGVTISDLRKPEVIETLAVACKHPVKAEHKKGKGGGFWFSVELEERAAIPRLVKFADMQPSQAAPALALPIGMAANKQQRWEDLRDLPHLLIAGATKQGKSVLVNAILCSLARRLPPERLQLYLCDLKGGMELAFYEELPHVVQFITRAGELPAMLLGLQAELERRTALLRGKARDLDGYNYQVGHERALPYQVVVVDEIANAMLNKDRMEVQGRKGTIAAITESTLADLAARARAVGIHLIISTQRPSVDVVTGLIKANFPCRIAFGTASEIDSRVIIDDGAAHGLAPGRMQFRRNMDLIELQAPFLSDAEVKKHVAAIAAGAPPEAPPETAEDRARREIAILLDVAEASFASRFPIRELATHADVAKHKIGRDRIGALAARLEREGILKKQFGPRPRCIRVSPQQWKAQYPLCVLHPVDGTNPAQTPAEPAGHKLNLVQPDAPQPAPGGSLLKKPRRRPAVGAEAP